LFCAARDGDVDGLRELLAVGVALVSDSGGKAPQGDKGIFGAGNVARVLAAFSRRSPRSASSWSHAR